jgi:hypothetical protein
MLCTRPDVSYALSAMSKYQSNYGDAHWTTVKNMLNYLRRTKEAFLVFRGEEELIVKGYSDASFQIDEDCVLPQWRGGELEKFQARYCSRFDDES